MFRGASEGKMNIPMVAAVVLFCLTLISIAMMSGFYAKYLTTGGNEDEARVAKFEVTSSATRFSDELYIGSLPGDVAKREIEVENNSEVAVNYIIRIENVTDNIPLKFVVVGEDETPTAEVYTFTGAIAPNQNAEYTMKITWDNENAHHYIGMVDLVKVTLTAEQID